MKTPKTVALIALTSKGVQQARLLRQRLRTGDLYRPAHHGPAQHGWEHTFDGPLAEQVPGWFPRHEQLVFFLAAGAVTRLIAPCLVSKESDPGVLAIDEAGHFVIPILSGHRGGANAFARTVAGCLGATPVVTTASDVIGGLSLDVLEETFCWTAEPRKLLKDAAIALVNKEPVAILQEIGTRGTWLEEMDLPDNVTLVSDSDRLSAPSFTQVLCVTDRLEPEPSDSGRAILWFRPKSLVLGVGCERGLSPQGLEQGLDIFLRQVGYAEACIDTLASATVKADEPALLELARRKGWNSVFYAAEELAQVPGMATPSALVQKCVGTPGVAEPAALLAAGADHLLVEKQVIRVPECPRAMTFALARHAQFQVKSSDRGKVYFVGAGPGDAQLLTLKAFNLLRRAEVVIYAGSLIPETLLRHVPATAQIHNSAHLTLEEVLALTLQSVRGGRRVVRLQSGDTSIYSAIQEQMAMLEKENVDFEVVPGISSFQALAAALKSEFTLPEKVQTIILTRGEGNTPMPEKESLALLAQHEATLCIFLSARLAGKVEEQLLTAYPPDTPIAIAHRVSWPDEQIIVTRLDRLAEEMRRHDFQRTTLIAVGAAIGGRHLRSQLYDERHGHIFRKRARAENDPAPERHLGGPAPGPGPG
ncbi:MAG TPA: precorrin-4 C(11)-methyltransferase [Gemmataceae bacterium]|jgi:precorrin-4 C11-methyltransferase|nr:precorrin-4 C(11)-methyltransferase [Gemmataceae bacterium]